MESIHLKSTASNTAIQLFKKAFSEIYAFKSMINNLEAGGIWKNPPVWEGKLNTEMKNAMEAAEAKAQYDTRAKRLLGHKIILAHILVKTVDEFLGMDPRDVVELIEGEPYIDAVPTEPGLTNKETAKNSPKAIKFDMEKKGKRLVGLNTEHVEVAEGLARFDIVFYVRMRDGLSQMIINIEAQKDEPEKYDILNRAIFYVSRLISSEKERDFRKWNYNDIKQVYSIWICMNMEENSMSHIHLVQDDLIGNHQWKGRLDLFNVIMVGVSNELPEHNGMYKLHRLLGALLSQELTKKEKLDIIEKEYEIPMEEDFREDVNIMCNLSEKIEEKGIEIGRAAGKIEGKMEGRLEAERAGEEKMIKMIMNMYRRGDTEEEIASNTEKDEEEVRDILAKNNCYVEKE